MSAYVVDRRVVRAGGLSVRYGVRTPTVGATLGLLVLAGVAAVLLTGAGDIAPDKVLAIMVGDYRGATSFEVSAVLDIRLPRALVAVVAGFGLGVSGAMFQALTDNPLGSPDIIGFTAGAATGAVAVLLTGLSWLPGTASAGALLGGLATAVLVYLLAWRGGVAGYRLILVGIGVTAVLGAVNSYLISRAELDAAAGAYRWLVGSLNGRVWADFWPLLVGTVVLIPLTVACQRPLDRLATGPDLARALGLRLERTRMLVVVVGTGWCAVAVAAAGPIGFVAMAAPQLVRRLTRTPGPHLVTSGLMAATLLLAADLIGMHALTPVQLPAGIVTAVLGGVYLIYVLLRDKGVRL